MAKVWAEESEWYPVVSIYKECPEFMDQDVFDEDAVEVNDELLARFEAAKKAFSEVNHEMLVTCLLRKANE